MRFLFWNVKKNSVGPILSHIAEDYAVDIVILAECADPNAILSDLNLKTEYPFHRTEDQTTRIVIYTRFPRENIRTAYGDKFLTIRRIGLLDRRPIVLAATHLPSKLFRDEYHLWEKAKSYPFFYNPMWGRFGDTTEGPAGTYYRLASSFAEYFWHIHDQVLIRPHLLDSFDEKSVRVLTVCGGRRFVRKSGIPDQSRVSDHLPLLFALTT